MVIKKLNSIFHKHSRVLLLILAVLVIIPFVLGDFRGGGCDDPQSMTVGTMNGKKVKVSDLRQFGQSLSLLGNSNRQDDWQSLFNAYCLVKYAEDNGVVVTDDEAAEELRKIFSKDGKFSKADYDKFLSGRRLTNSDVVESLRLNMTIQKLQQTVCRGVVVTDDEVKSFYELASPGFDLEICAIPLKKFRVDEPKEKDLKEFYSQISKFNPNYPAYDEVKKNLPEMYKSVKQRETAVKLAEQEIAKLLKLNGEKRAQAFAALKFDHKKLSIPANAAEMEKINKDMNLMQVYQSFCLDLPKNLAMIPQIEKSNNPQLLQFMLGQINQALIGGLPQELSLQSGDIARPVNLSDAVALVRVVKRKPAALQEFAKNQEILRKLMTNLKEQLVFQDFYNELMRQCVFTMETAENKQAE
ncbi:MAG: SurA N-terminal domain-containing protein [Lentisphaeria bacterium]|nr:SurA N-terminal domain-containing protein [Lentisphaeria bacterium]